MGINDILAAIDNMKRVGARNIGDLGRDPIGALSKIAHNVKEQLSTEEGAKEFMYNSMAPGVGGIIKGKGGNWLTGSVENALSGLKKRVRTEGINGHTAENVAQDSALNNWIEGPLTKYVKRDMATEGDPVRKLAEQNITFVEPNYWTQRRIDADGDLMGKRRAIGGVPTEPAGVNPAARSWEGISDEMIRPRRLGDQRQGSSGGMKYRELIETDPGMEWIANAPDDTIVNEMSRNRRSQLQMADDLGFDHLTDELSNALNPESGLPRHLQLTPEQMQQLGMEKAVRHVADINAWRAAQQAEANLAKSQSPAVHMVREYAENNPKGLKWTELRQPEAKLEEGWKVIPQGDTGLFEVVDDIGRQRSVGASEKEAIGLLNRKEREQLLAEQLKYEGDTMGHCVGGYCDDVASGKSRIFSLRDAKGEPHVTIEVEPPSLYPMSGNKLMEKLGERGKGIWDSYVKAVNETGTDLMPFLEKHHPDVISEMSSGPSNIIQIKGKQNAKPKDEYLPFVQDFVRNHPEGGKWGDVGDFRNTGLIDRLSLPGNKMTSETPQWLTPDEVRALGEDPDKLFRNFANGGLVQGNYQPVEFDGVTGYILR